MAYTRTTLEPAAPSGVSPVESLEPVLETALDAVVIIRGDGTVVAWNGAAERTFGWASAEAVGSEMAALIVPPQHREAHCAGLARYLATGEEHVLGKRIEITALTKAGEEFPVELSITKTFSEEGDLFIGFLRDISERRQSEAAMKRRAHEAELLFGVTRMAAETESFDQALHSCLAAICELTGWPVGHALVMSRAVEPELVSTSVWFETVPGSSAALRQATADGRFTKGVGLPGMILETREPMWISDAERHPSFVRKGLGFVAAFGFPIKSEGKIIAVLEFFATSQHEPDAELMLTVRTLGEQVGRLIERKRTEEHQRLLVNELNHRVKNTLAIVQSVAAQTFKGDAALPAARRAFESRLAALAAAHDVLTGQNWESASLRQIVEKAGVGCGADPDRVHVEGPDLRLEPKSAVSLALALHELCTNSIKYGALSNEDGSVSVNWRVARESLPRLLLCWKESGGPPVAPPRHRGFGSRMIERVLATELSGTVTLEFPAEGVVCTLDAPLHAATGTSTGTEDP